MFPKTANNIIGIELIDIAIEILKKIEFEKELIPNKVIRKINKVALNPINSSSAIVNGIFLLFVI